MKIIHIESGLGNQMLSYCEFLSMKKANPHDEIYIENLIYDIPECNEIICQWNGYELKNIFGITAPNIRDIFSAKDWIRIMTKIRESRFWEKNWNYPVYFTQAFEEAGMTLINTFGNFEDPKFIKMGQKPQSDSFRGKIKNSLPYLYLKHWKNVHYYHWHKKQADYYPILFPESDKNLFAGQKLLFKQRGSHIEEIEKEIRETFVFPPFTDDRNRTTYEHIRNCNSIAIHARRGDLLSLNYICYATGYFRHAVAYLKKKVCEPEFFIFCDPGSISWAKENGKTLGLDFNKDKVHFVDWNKTTESYRDMQLMAACRHQIITYSSFSWWGAWLNTNPGKITCSPDSRLNTTHTF